MTASLAVLLDTAARTATAIAQPPGIDLAAAYRTQRELIALRVGRGDRVVGCKLGFTSRAKMAQMGVSEVIAGQLTGAMRVPDGGTVDLSRFIHPRIEPELAFRLARDVDPDDPLVDIEHAVDGVAVALEIIDSRYREFRFSLPDVVADNASAAAFAIGPWHGVDAGLGNRAVLLDVDGHPVEIGSTAAILGHPVRALHALVALAHRHRIPLPAGQIVLAGAATVAVPFTDSVVRARIAGLDPVTVRGHHG